METNGSSSPFLKQDSKTIRSKNRQRMRCSIKNRLKMMYNVSAQNSLCGSNIKKNTVHVALFFILVHL
jgi:hypothetical protein